MQPAAAQIAIESIGTALSALYRPTGRMMRTDALVSGIWEDTYRVPGVDPHVRARLQANGSLGTSPEEEERVRIVEALMGAALAVAQAYLTASRFDVRTATSGDNRAHIWRLANYWKHRDDWGGSWSGAHNHMRAGIAALLGSSPQGDPAAAGTLQLLAEKALGAPFDVNSLWAAISLAEAETAARTVTHCVPCLRGAIARRVVTVGPLYR